MLRKIFDIYIYIYIYIYIFIYVLHIHAHFAHSPPHPTPNILNPNPYPPHRAGFPSTNADGGSGGQYRHPAARGRTLVHGRDTDAHTGYLPGGAVEGVGGSLLLDPREGLTALLLVVPRDES